MRQKGRLVRGPADYILLAMQWVILLWGIFTALMALHLYTIENAYLSALPPAPPNVDYFLPPTAHRLVVGLCTGFATMGIGGILFYLRRLYLAR